MPRERELKEKKLKEEKKRERSDIEEINEMKRARLNTPSRPDAEDYRIHAPIGSAPRREGAVSLMQSRPAASDGSDADDNARRIFLGNLSYQANEESICDFFEQCGKIENIHFVTDKQTGTWYGSAFVRFQSVDAVPKALALNGELFLRRPIKIGACNKGVVQPIRKPLRVPPMRDRPAGCTTIFVGGLPEDVTDDDMWKAFNACGEITDVRYVTDPNTGEFRRCAFVEFKQEAATKAAASIHGTLLKGRTLRLDYVDPK